KWKGNKPPVLLPTIPSAPQIGAPVQFKANASDPDGKPIKTLKWFFEDGALDILQETSIAECSLRAPGQVSQVTGQPFVCPWTEVSDNADQGVSFTYSRPGTFSVLVMAEDEDGGVSAERINITVGLRAPTLVVNPTGIPIALPPAIPNTPEGTTVGV